MKSLKFGGSNYAIVVINKIIHIPRIDGLAAMNDFKRYSIPLGSSL